MFSEVLLSGINNERDAVSVQRTFPCNPLTLENVINRNNAEKYTSQGKY